MTIMMSKPGTRSRSAKRSMCATPVVTLANLQSGRFEPLATWTRRYTTGNHENLFQGFPGVWDDDEFEESVDQMLEMHNWKETKNHHYLCPKHHKRGRPDASMS
jgi:hypothetical protein